MGLRVILYTPEDTSADAASGVLGLIVVFARRNVVKPDTLKLTPLAAITRTRAPRARAGISQGAVIREMPHMRKATITATAERNLKFKRLHAGHIARDQRLLPSTFFTLRASTSMPSTHRTLIAANFAPVFGCVPIAND